MCANCSALGLGIGVAFSPRALPCEVSQHNDSYSHSLRAGQLKSSTLKITQENKSRLRIFRVG